MDLAISRTTLHKTLAHLVSVSERKTTIPVLGNVLLQATPGKLQLTATDLEITLSDLENAEVASEGTTTVNLRVLTDIVRLQPPDATIRLAQHAQPDTVRLSAGRFSTVLPTIPIKDFPTRTHPNFAHTMTVGTAELLRLLTRTAPAMSTDLGRYFLNGVHMHVSRDGTQIVAVATDGHRLAVAETNLPPSIGSSPFPDIIVPRKAIIELARLLTATTAESVTLELSTTILQVTAGTAVLSTKLVDATFPDYQRIIPHDAPMICELAPAPLAKAAGRVAAVTSERERPLGLEITPGSIVLTSRDGASTASEELDPEDFSIHTTTGLRVGMQTRYLIDALEQIKGRAQLFVKDASSPIVLQDTAERGSVYLIMPLRL